MPEISDTTKGMPAIVFPHDVLQLILFALKSDTSVRIRRLGIEVLQNVMARSLGHLTLNTHVSYFYWLFCCN